MNHTDHNHNMENMDHYQAFCCREKRFQQPERNPHADVVLGDLVEYDGAIWTVGSTQVLGSTDGVALVHQHTKEVRKVFGQTNLKTLIVKKVDQVGDQSSG